DDSNYRKTRIALNAGSGQQITLAFLFPAEIVGRIVSGDVPVSLRIPLIVINPVEDAGHSLRTLFKNAFQSEAELRGLNLLAVLPAHGRDHVRVGEGAFEEIYVAEVLHFGDSEQIPGQHQERKNLWRE